MLKVEPGGREAAGLSFSLVPTHNRRRESRQADGDVLRSASSIRFGLLPVAAMTVGFSISLGIASLLFDQ